jgi:hypothetical protein
MVFDNFMIIEFSEMGARLLKLWTHNGNVLNIGLQRHKLSPKHQRCKHTHQQQQEVQSQLKTQETRTMTSSETPKRTGRGATTTLQWEMWP